MLEDIISMVPSTLEQGLIYALLALGLYISYSVLNFPDLSVDGTFPLGSAVTAVLITAGVSPWLCLPVSFLCGAAAGMITGIIHVKCNVTNLLSGILMMTALYSVNLSITGVKSSLFIMGKDTVFNGAVAKLIPSVKNGNVSFSAFGHDYNFYVDWLQGVSVNISKLLVAVVCVLIVKYVFDLYMKTKSGMMLRVCGANEQMVKSMSVDSGKVKMLGLAIANGLVALSGSLMCQYKTSFNISDGTGTMVIGLASVIIGLTVMRKVKFLRITSKVVLGSIIYYACIRVALSLGLEAHLLKLMIAVLFLVMLVFNDKILKGVKTDAGI